MQVPKRNYKSIFTGLMFENNVAMRENLGESLEKKGKIKENKNQFLNLGQNDTEQSVIYIYIFIWQTFVGIKTAEKRLLCICKGLHSPFNTNNEY